MPEGAGSGAEGIGYFVRILLILLRVALTESGEVQVFRAISSTV